MTSDAKLIIYGFAALIAVLLTVNIGARMVLGLAKAQFSETWAAIQRIPSQKWQDNVDATLKELRDAIPSPDLVQRLVDSLDAAQAQALQVQEVDLTLANLKLQTDQDRQKLERTHAGLRDAERRVFVIEARLGTGPPRVVTGDPSKT